MSDERSCEKCKECDLCPARRSMDSKVQLELLAQYCGHYSPKPEPSEFKKAWKNYYENDTVGAMSIERPAFRAGWQAALEASRNLMPNSYAVEADLILDKLSAKENE